MFQKWEIGQDGVLRFSGSHVGKHMFDRQPLAADDGFAGENFRVHCYARQQRTGLIIDYATSPIALGYQ
jgi:hypothetical protein